VVVELVPTSPHANPNSPMIEGCGAELLDCVPLEEKRPGLFVELLL